MPRSPSEEPEGLLLRPELLTAEEEAELLERLGELRLDPIVMHGQAARRTARHYGLGYDYKSRTPDVLAGEAPRSWQHSIPPTKELRYSITFRTLRRTSAAGAAGP